MESLKTFNIKDENILNGESKDIYLELRDAIMASARAKAISAKLEESATGRLEKENKINTELEKSRKELIKVQKSTSDNYDIMIGGGTAGMGTEIRITKKQQLANIYQDIKKHNQDLADLTAEGLKEDSFFLKEQEKLEKASAKLTYDRTHLKEEAKPKKDKSAEEAAKAEKERRENEFKGEIADLENKKVTAKNRLELFKGEVKDKIALSMNLASKEIDLAEKVYQYNVFLAEKDKGLLSKATSEKSTAIQNAFKENIERTGKFYSDYFKKADESLPKTLFGDKYKMTNEQKADLKAHEDYIKKTLDEIKNYLGSFSSELGSNLGFKETFDFFIKVDEKGKNMWQKLDQEGVSSKEKFATRFNAIAESAQEAFNFISNLSQENIKDEYNRLDKQKEISLGFAGDSAAAKEKIEEDYNKKKNEIAKKEAKAKKEQAIMNIAIDTAQAIMGLWVKPGFPAAIPMAIAVGALGAIQIGMVASQKIPQYAKGTDNHSGGLMLVNDGAGSNFQEKVILPSGKVIRPQGRNVLMDAPKGTKVLNHEQQLFEMLQSNNISMSNPQYQGMTPDEMDEILGKHFGNIKTQNTIFDKNGFQSYVRNGNSITRSNSNRSQAIGISV